MLKYDLNMYFAYLSVCLFVSNKRRFLEILKINEIFFFYKYAKFVSLILSIQFKMAEPIESMFCGFLYSVTSRMVFS